jgi:hypothetical protein
VRILSINTAQSSTYVPSGGITRSSFDHSSTHFGVRRALYLPPDDRRYYVAWSQRTRSDFDADYWTQIYEWYAGGGMGHVAAYLASYDLSAFNSKAPPRQTAAFHAMVDASRAPEDAEVEDALDRLGYPPALTLEQLGGPTDTEFSAWLKDRKSSRQIPHRLEAVGYVAVWT